MDQSHRDLLSTMDLHALGRRLRSARSARGLTQSDLAGGELSVGYISRIEAGQRRPKPTVLEALAARLGVPVEQFVTGVAPQERDEIRLLLDFAELSLEMGEVREGRERAREAVTRAEAAGLDEYALRAHYLLARAHEALGELDDAILELEPLVGASHGLTVEAAIALSRCYRDSGDFTKAVETAEAVLDELREVGLDHSDEAVRLAATLAAAYFERGDTSHAARVCRRTVESAERLGSASARAAAYWNASLVEEKRGKIQRAIPLAERALALLGEGTDTRNLARLRTQLGVMQLRADPPEVAEAKHHLEQAAKELASSSAAPVDVARNELALARTMLYGGEAEAARARSIEIHHSVRDVAPLVAADAKTLQGQAEAALGDTGAAVRAFQEAVLLLTGLGADRTAAQLWFELGGLLDEIGESTAALAAFRSAAAATGLRGRPTRAFRVLSRDGSRRLAES